MEAVSGEQIDIRQPNGTSINTRTALDAWRVQRTPSNSIVRLQLCSDLTIVQGAALLFWHIAAWVAHLHSIALHQLALYEGYYCIQFTILLFLENLLDFLDGWNVVRTKPHMFNLAKSVLDVVANVAVRAVGCGSIALLAMFSTFNLRIVELHSITNILISVLAVSNFVLLLHATGALLEDYIIGNGNRRDRPASVRNGPFGGVATLLSSLNRKVMGPVCWGAHLALHLWPLANSILLSSLVAVIVLLSRKSLDAAWKTTQQLTHARAVTRESKQLVWPTGVLMMQFLYDVVLSVLRISREYAIRFIVSTCEIVQVDENRREQQVHRTDESTN